jgi:membrane protease YdiL (CAAX protease family)
MSPLDAPGAARRQVITYLVLVFALSSFFYVPMIRSGRMSQLLILGLMWSPGVAALITRLVYQRNLRGIGWGWGKTRYQGLAYIVPVLAALPVYGLVWATGLGAFTPGRLTGVIGRELEREVPFPQALLLLATAGFLMSCLSGLGEEIGWRGLLVPELSRLTSFGGTVLISGTVWAVYHYPLILFSNYNSGAPKWFVMLCFTWMVFMATIGFNWLRLKSGSVWTAVILHASHNLFIQQVFDGVTTDQGPTEYLTTEFGLGLALANTGIAWICWRPPGGVQRSSAIPDNVATLPLPVS